MIICPVSTDFKLGGEVELIPGFLFMNNMILNGQDSVATSAVDFDKIIVNVGSICPDFLKYNLRKYGYKDLGDGMYVAEVPEDDTILRVHMPNGNWFNVVKNHSIGSRCNWEYVTDQVKHIVCGHYNVPEPKYFDTFNDWVEDLYEYGFCSSDKRWAKIRADYEASYNA